MEEIVKEQKINNIAPSSLKNEKFKGLTAEQIIQKYENVLFSREKQFYELSQEITKTTDKIQVLMKRKEKSKNNNDLLKEILTKNENLLKQELSNKEIAFMKLTDLEHKYDDLQNKIDDIIIRQNALADSTQREREKMNQDKEEGKKLIDKESLKEKNEEKELNIEKNEKKEENNEIRNDNINNKENEKEKIKIINENDNTNENEMMTKKETSEKKGNSILVARERLNKLKKEKNEGVKKLNLSDFINQSNNNINNNE